MDACKCFVSVCIRLTVRVKNTFVVCNTHVVRLVEELVIVAVLCQHVDKINNLVDLFSPIIVS